MKTKKQCKMLLPVLFLVVLVITTIILVIPEVVNTTADKGKVDLKRDFADYTERVKMTIADKKSSIIQRGRLPNSLIAIEDEAFEGTALKYVSLPKAIQFVGDYAFAHILSLKSITIPNTVVFIGSNVFLDSNQVTITGAPKSYARSWAEKNGIPFSPIDSFYAYEYSAQIIGTSFNRLKSPRLIIPDRIVKRNTKKQTGRLVGEITATRYMEFTEFHIQGRSPPLA